MNAILVFSLIVSSTALKYVQEGAVLTEPETLELNNPSPLTIRINNYQLCSENPIICFKNNVDDSTLQGQCQMNYCDIRFDFQLKRSYLGGAVIEGNSMIFKQTFQIVSLPQNCEIMIVGATDPKPATESSAATSPKSTTALTTTEASGEMSATIKIVIAVCVVIIVILLMLSGGTIFFFVFKPRMRSNAERRRQAANARDVEAGESANLIAPQPPQAPKKTTKKPSAKSKEAKSVDAATTTVQKTEDGDMKESSVQRPTSSFEPAPMPSASRTNAPQEDRTQDSPTGSEGTPPMDQKTAPQMKQSSVFKPNHYMPRAQATVPYKTRKNFVDSLDQILPYSETVLASLERLQRVTPTVQMLVVGGWNLKVDHVMSKLEKDILRKRLDLALDALEQLTRELDAGLLTHGARYGSNDTNEVTWAWVNQVTTPASAAHRLFIMSYPVITEDVEASVEDPLIKDLSVPGLYAMLFFDGFDREFKSKLILEVKARACNLFNNVPANNLVGAAFPLSYMARRYQMDKNAFITGKRLTSRERR